MGARVGFAAADFEIRKRIGQWGEDTFTAYFDAHPEAGLKTLEYGEAFAGRKKQKGDAVARPDLLLIERKAWAELVQRSPDKAAQDLRLLPDSDPWVREVVAASTAAAEIKFSHRVYVEGRIKFILDEHRKTNYESWLERTEGIGELVFWLTTTRAFMAPVEQVFRDGVQKRRDYESQGPGATRSKNTWNLPVESALPFAEVVYELNKSLVPKFRVWEKSGAIGIGLTDPPGSFKNPDLAGLRDLAKTVRR
jgi:hypothetical protein